MKIARLLLAIAAVATSCVAIYHLCWLRFRCEIEKGRIESRLSLAFETHDFRRQDIGRAAIPHLMACVARDSGDYHARFLLGKAAEAAGQNDLALSMYESALTLNERPEIYASIGVLQLEMGRMEEARRALTQAVLFKADSAITVSEPLRSELQRTAAERHARLGAAKAAQR